MKTEYVRIDEAEDGSHWIVSTGGIHDSAADALRRVRADAKRLGETEGYSRVVTVVDSDGDELDYFVAPQENKVAGMLLASPTSPLGSALIGAGVGDDVAYEAPAGTFTVKVTSVRPYDGG